MSAWALLAPGPSATREQAEQAAARGLRIGVVGNAFELYPEAEFLAASDRRWWRMHPQALEFEGAKYSAQDASGVRRLREKSVQRLRVESVRRTANAGVLALEAAVQRDATSVELYGFDMHGSHFFGPYTNGLTNTTPERRQAHLEQYAQWAAAHPMVRVINCTPGSRLTCFEVLA